jgi:hypothetical protein
MEDKATICDLLCVALQATRNHGDLRSIQYVKEQNGDETAVLTWENGGQRRVNVSMDSGTAMIRDIMKAID